jgi:hypothetical protein
MTTVSRLLCGATLAALPLLFAGVSVNAQAITPILVGTSPAGGGLTAFTYDIDLGVDSTATASGPTSGLTFFDFKGLSGTPVYTPVAPGATFTVSTPLTGTQAPNPVIGQSDSAALPNIDLSYTGVTIVDDAVTTTVLGTLVADSTGSLAPGFFTGFSSISKKTSTGTIAANQSYVEGPNSPGTPEPGAIAMLSGMGISAGMFLRRRK